MRKLLKSKVAIAFIVLAGIMWLYLRWYNVENLFQYDSEDLAIGGMLYAVLEGHLSEYGLLRATESGMSGFVLGAIKNNWAFNEVSYQNYASQIGLQGYAYQLLAIILCSSKGILYLIRFRELLCAVCCALMAAVSMGIVVAVGKKYNYKLSLAFFITFLLSPWVKDFSVNLYWVEFTWYIPMLLGMVMSLDYKKFDKLWFYVLVFFAVAVKSACGYEYITTVMLGLILVPLVDLFTAKRDERKSMFVIIFKLGVAALLGFFVALFIHALMRGDGNVIVGLESIYQSDVLRRTVGENLAVLDISKREGIKPTVGETLQEYFEFKTEPVDGLSGEIFVPLIVFALLVFAARALKKDNRWELPFYIASFVCTVSWYILGKQHSYVHIHINFVLWYFGFVQMLIYSLFCAFSDCLLNNLGKNNIIKCLNVK